MSTRPEPVKLGPFSGGLNLLAEPQNINDSELTECINFEVDVDGSLMNRPAIVETTDNGANGSGGWTPIGRADLAGGNYLIASQDNGGTCVFDGLTWTYITGAVSDIALQYNNTVYILARQDSVSNGGSWNGTSFTSDATLPRASSAVFHKSRLFTVPGVDAVTNTSRLTFSDTITSSTITWTGTNIIDVSPGDGERLVDIVVYNDNLLLFKENSIYLLAYDISPSDAVLRKIHSNIGVNATHCIDTYDSSVYFLHKGIVWEMQDYEFKRISFNVPFVFDPTFIPNSAGSSLRDEVWLRRMGDRLLVGFYKKRYSYYLPTRTWSEWQVDSIVAQLFGPPMQFEEPSTDNEPVRYYMGTSTDGFDSFYYVTDKYIEGTRDSLIRVNSNSVLPEEKNIICSIQTKNFDFDIPFSWKRLVWWGMHAYTGTVIDARTIINNVTQTNDTWETVALYTWDTLTGTWGNMLTNFEYIEEVQGSSVAGSKFYRFPKSLRFRSISFKVIIENDGSTLDGPCRLFTLTATVGLKQVVSKDMN
jgi:hypothetical protein